MSVGGWLNKVQPKFFEFLNGKPRAGAGAAPPAEQPVAAAAAPAVEQAPAPPAAPPAPPPAAAQPQAPPQPEPQPVPEPPPAAAPPPAPAPEPAAGAIARPTPVLVGQDGALAGQRVEVAAPATIGRENADIVIEDQEISRRHAVLQWNQASLEISDLGSANGTFVNGQRIVTPQELQHGDVVKVGQTTFAIELPAPPAPRDPGATVITPG